MVLVLVGAYGLAWLIMRWLNKVKGLKDFCSICFGGWLEGCTAAKLVNISFSEGGACRAARLEKGGGNWWFCDEKPEVTVVFLST